MPSSDGRWAARTVSTAWLWREPFMGSTAALPGGTREFGLWRTIWTWKRLCDSDGTWDRTHGRLLADANATDHSTGQFSGLDYRSNPLTRDECCPFDGSMRTATTAAQQATDGSLPSPIAVHLWETSSLCLQLFTRNYWSTTLTVRPLRSWTGRLFPVWMALSASSCARPSSIGVSSTSHCTFSEQGGVVRLPV